MTKSRSEQVSFNIMLSGSKADFSTTDCSDWRRFAIVLADFDFATWWTKTEICLNSGPVCDQLFDKVSDIQDFHIRNQCEDSFKSSFCRIIFDARQTFFVSFSRSNETVRQKC